MSVGRQYLRRTRFYPIECRISYESATKICCRIYWSGNLRSKSESSFSDDYTKYLTLYFFSLHLILTSLSSTGVETMVPKRNVLERTQCISIKLEFEFATQLLAFVFLLLIMFYDFEPADKEEGYSTD